MQCVYLRLHSRIKEEKEKEEPKTIPLRVYGKGLNTFAIVRFCLVVSVADCFIKIPPSHRLSHFSDQTKTLPVSNWDSANEVIRLALQQFGIIVSEPDKLCRQTSI